MCSMVTGLSGFLQGASSRMFRLIQGIALVYGEFPFSSDRCRSSGRGHGEAYSG